MAIHPNQAGRMIFTGIFKVLNQASPRWTTIKPQPVRDVFVGVANPTSWPTFFRDAVATSIQQELILHGSYCPGLEDELKRLHDSDLPWSELEAFVKSRVRNIKVKF